RTRAGGEARVERLVENARRRAVELLRQGVDGDRDAGRLLDAHGGEPAGRRREAAPGRPERHRILIVGDGERRRRPRRRRRRGSRRAAAAAHRARRGHRAGERVPHAARHWPSDDGTLCGVTNRIVKVSNAPRAVALTAVLPPPPDSAVTYQELVPARSET